MKTKEQVTELLTHFRHAGDQTMEFDEEAILAAYQKNKSSQSLAIKILSIFGGLLASLAFTGFLFVSGIAKSEEVLLGLGIISIIGSLWMNQKQDKIIMDTIRVSAFLMGFTLLGVGLAELDTNESIICSVFIMLSCISLILTRNYILSFVSVLILNGSIITLLICNNAYNLIPIYTAVLALATTYFLFKEARIITKIRKRAGSYDPVRAGLVCALLSALILTSQSGIYPVSPAYFWLCAVIMIAAILRLTPELSGILEITTTGHKIMIYLFVVLSLLPTVPSPAISGALLVMLLSFLRNYKTGFVLGVLTFIYAVCHYYYDLSFTLLTKSMLLGATGLLFLIIYLYTHKKLMPDENV